jgi:hypothetical protein
MQATFQVGENRVRRVQYRGNVPERNSGIGNLHKVDVTS